MSKQQNIFRDNGQSDFGSDLELKLESAAPGHYLLVITNPSKVKGL